MKINDIIVEGLWDNLNGAATAGKAEFQKRQKEDNFQRNMKRFIDGDTALIAKDWKSAQRSLPNYNELIRDPEQYYNAVAKFAADKYKTAVPSNINAPATIDPQGAADVIQKIVSSFHYARHAPTPDQSGAPAHEPQTTAPDTAPQPDYHTPVAPKGQGEQPDYESPMAPAPKKTASRPAATMPVDAPQPQLRRRAKKSVPVPDIRDRPSIEQQPSTTASTSVAAAPVSPAIKQQAPLNFSQILQSVDLLSKSEQRKLLGQLLQRTNEPISGNRR